MKDCNLKLYKNMVLIRLTEESIAKNYNKEKMRCPTHLSIGQEAAASGVGLALSKDDLAVSTHRSHAHYLAKGGNLKRMIAEIHGKVTGCSKGRGGSMHLIDRSVGFEGSTAIVGNSMPIGVGLGMALKLNKSKNISIVFCGDGSTEEGVFYESVNFAACKNLPVLFICENNAYSVYSPLQVRQPLGRRIHEMVQSMGVESMHEDGNDVNRVYQATLAARKKILKSNKPFFLELKTYRWLEHCGPNYDNDIGYRSEDEFQEWKKKCPIKKYEKILLDNGTLTKELIRSIRKHTQTNIDQAFKFSYDSEFPTPKDALSGVFA